MYGGRRAHGQGSVGRWLWQGCVQGLGRGVRELVGGVAPGWHGGVPTSPAV